MYQLSIITVNLNNAKGLKKTLESIACQTFTDYEHLIIDGGSTDSSVDFIKEYYTHYKGVPNGLYWVSEPDSGIYNAMNKGISLAKGKYCYFLNSGDTLISETSLERIPYSNDTDLIYFNIILDNQIKKYPLKINLFFLCAETICHQALIIKRELFSLIGNYNEDERIISDWIHLFTSLVTYNASYSYYDCSICNYNTDGISSDPINFAQINEQRKNFLIRNFPAIYDAFGKYLSLKANMQFYESSRLVQFVTKLQKSKLYSFLRH